MQAIYSNFLKQDVGVFKLYNKLYLSQSESITKKYMFKTISHHANIRIKERFKYRGYTIQDIKKDILKAKKRKIKNKFITIKGEIGDYVISESRVLVTVI